MSDALVAERQAGLAEWKNDSLVHLAKWAEYIGVDPAQIIDNPLVALPEMERLLGDEDLAQLSDDDFNWLAARVMNYIAAVFKWRHGGEWVVDDRPDSPSYARYVVRGSDGKHYDPGRALMAYFDQRPRELIPHIADAEGAAT